MVDHLNEVGEGGVASEVAKCSSWLLGPWMTVNKGEKGHRHLSGLNHCERNLCPVCAPYLAAKRQEKLAPIVAGLVAKGGLRFVYLVLTLRHHHGAKWRELYDTLRACQRDIGKHRRWKEAVAGSIRTLETTHGQHGHHPHDNLILAIPEGEDLEGFMAWIEERFQALAKKRGRSADWRPGWWSEVEPEALGQVVGYLAADDKLNAPPAVLREALGAPTKHQPVWCMPGKAFAEVWRDSKGVRWFGVGGCFKDAETDKTDEELGEERETTGEVLAHIPKEVWKSWKPQERRDRLAILSDASLAWEQVAPVLVAWGGVLGAPGDPWEGAGERGEPPGFGLHPRPG